ncbi:MAG: complex I NDUFA9 subunit family protein [Bacillota bacterium]
MELQRALVAGGTGFIGSHLARRLVLEGYEVSVLSRHAGKGGGPAGAMTGVAGDVLDLKGLVRILPGFDVLVIAVQFPGAPVEKPRRGQTYLHVDGQGTINLAAAARTAGVKRIVYISGAGTRPGQKAPWFQAKLIAEAAVRDSGIPYTIFRPSWVYGPEDRSLNQFVAFARRLPFVPVIGSGRTRIQPLLVDDLADAVALCLGREAAVNQTYDIGGPQTLTMDEIIRTMLTVMGKRKPLLHTPGWLMKAAAAPLTLLPSPPFSPGAVDFVLMEEPVDNGPVLRDLGLTLQPLARGLDYLKA